MVGTANGSNVSNSLRSMGTEMRPVQGSNERSDSESVCGVVAPPAGFDLITSVLTCFGVDAEGALQQMVHPFTDVHIQPRVTILQHDFFLKVLALFGSALREERFHHFGPVFITSLLVIF